MLTNRSFWNISRKMLRVYLIASVLVLVFTFPNNGYRSERSEDEHERKLFDTHQAILDQGYPAETHYVTTDDGYILQVTRIPHSKNETSPNKSRPVVFMMHGLTAAANSFIFLGSEYSIGYHLVDAGFDVWMGNARGNYYSRAHVTLDPDHPEEKFDFFDFSFEEIGMYDVASMIDYILEKTSRDQLHYIGHSQGGTVFLVLTTMRPEYNQKIKAAHLLAAVGYQEHFPNTQLASAANMVDIIYNMALMDGLVEYFPFNFNQGQKRSNDPDYCFGDIKYKNMCDLVGASEITKEDTETVDLSAGASLKQFAHFGQNIRDKAFRRWNYGTRKNNEIYGSRNPPAYDLSLITTHVTLIYSLNDTMLDERDALAMANDISKSKVHKVSRESFLHEEYVTGTDAKELVTNYIIEDILKLEAGDVSDWVNVEEIEEGGTEEKDPDIVPEGSEVTPDVPSSTTRITCSVLVPLYLIIIGLYIF